ncbi:hypothetical protein [Streptomyces sp. NPDC001340]
MVSVLWEQSLRSAGTAHGCGRAIAVAYVVEGEQDAVQSPVVRA